MIFYFNFHLPKIPGLHVCEASLDLLLPGLHVCEVSHDDKNLNFDSLPTCM
jgi:hypothetical protein